MLIRKKNSPLSDSSLMMFLLVVLVYSVIAITKHQSVRLTADSMLYFSLADKYISGDIQNAVNGYWGPLLAWLLIPFKLLGASDVLTINMLDLIIGVLTMTGVWILSFRFEISGIVRNLILISLVPIVLKFSVVQPMDFLLVCILVFYLGIVFREDYYSSTLSGVYCGILGSLAYLTKAYAFPFFVVHFFVMNIFHYFRNRSASDRKKVFINTLAGLLMFALLSGTWIMIISDKYGHFTFSTMRETNFNAPSPEVTGEGLEFGVPVFVEGFFEPPNETAFVVWEDPSYLRGTPWSAWQSWTHFKHFIKLTVKNLLEGLRIFESFSALSIAILLVNILFIIRKPKHELLSNGALIYPLFTIVLFTGGYLLFHLEERYLWLVNVLLLLMGGHVLTALIQKDYFQSGPGKGILILFFILSFTLIPAKYVVKAKNGGMDSEMYLISTDLKEYNIKGNIASNRECVPVHDAWHKTFRLAYWLDSRYYGQRGENLSDEELIKELKNYNIDYYFFWGDASNIPPFLYGAKEITKGKIPGLRVYSLKDEF